MSAANTVEGVQIAESVCPGHPDKVADQISDAVVDAHLSVDPDTRVNCEVLVTRDRVIATGQITSAADVDVEKVVRDVLGRVGYHDLAVHGMSATDSRVDVLLDRQSREIADGVDRGGAGDSGIVYGYATDETPERIPLACVLAHAVAKGLAAARTPDGHRLGPDGKVQISLSATGDRIAVDGVVSIQHPADTGLDTVRELVADAVVGPILAERSVTLNSIHVNPAGTFVVGGPSADAGLTGRKLMVDTYGGLVRHGGGCFSGKDGTKVDRSGAYLARHLALAVVAAGQARRCQVGIGYAIGRPEPVWFGVDCFGTGVLDSARIAALLRENVDIRVGPVLERFDLSHVSYLPTAVYGHFGRPGEFPWEDVTMAEQLCPSVDGIR
jgi:S-adenosylmethionine synthetase